MSLDKRLQALESQQPTHSTHDELTAFFEMLIHCRDIFQSAMDYEASELERQSQWTLTSDYHYNQLDRMRQRLELWQALQDVIDTLDTSSCIPAQEQLARLIDDNPATLATFTHGQLKFEYTVQLMDTPHWHTWEQVRDYDKS